MRSQGYRRTARAGAAAVLGLIAAACGRGNGIKANPTFSEDIAPIIWNNCAPCHRPGEAGPFSLLTYDDASKRASMIRRVTQSRYMPPWPADPSYSHFIGERVLKDSDIETIKRWVDNGSPAGDLSKLPPQPRFYSGSMLGKPDMVVKMREPVHLPGDNTDRFFVIKIPYEIPQEKYIRAIEFVPQHRHLLHHMNGHIVEYEDGKKKDLFQGPDVADRGSLDTLEESYPLIHLLNDDGSYPELLRSVSNYLPGASSAVVYPEGIGGWVLKKKGAFLMRDVHYGPSKVAVDDQSSFNVFFMDKPPVRPTKEMQLGTLGVSEIVPPLIIPPNVVKTFTTRTVLDEDISLLTVNPHMHMLGKSFEAFAVRPDGQFVPLVKIPKWNFHWQYFYTFPKPVHLPKGSTVAVIGVYDNTANNPDNPFSPPQEVIGTNGSMKATNEMFQLIMTYVPYKPGDENISLDAHLAE